jgi:hypothetical protein
MLAQRKGIVAVVVAVIATEGSLSEGGLGGD